MELSGFRHWRAGSQDRPCPPEADVRIGERRYVLRQRRIVPMLLERSWVGQQPGEASGGWMSEWGGGGAASFTVEWFPHCESPARPPHSHPYQLRRAAKPAWEMGPTCRAWRIARPDCRGLEAFWLLPSPTFPGSDLSRAAQECWQICLVVRWVPGKRNGMGGVGLWAR